MGELTITRAPALATTRMAFVATIFAGSFLLFLVQPMFGRMILPRLGGAPSVWNTAMLFYQGMLLLGYLYAHRLSRLPLKRQLAVHGAMFALAALSLPVGLAGFYPQDPGAWPALWLIGLLGVSIGPTFFLVSSQAPLMQAWFARSDDPDAASPYFLYAASNAGSLLALAAYPLLVEPRLALAAQSWLWSAGFLALALMAVGCGLIVRGSRAPISPFAAIEVEPAGTRCSWRDRLGWMMLAAIPSGLLLSTTTHITTDVMAMPLLWVIPLALYLATFIIAFAPSAAALRRATGAAAPAFVYLAGAVIMIGSASQLGNFASQLALFFVAALGLHGALAERQPPASQLTEFYLWMSIGGVLGGLFCALVAPMAFDWTYEHPLLIVAALALLPARTVPAPLQRLWALPVAGRALKVGVPLAFLAFALVGLRADAAPGLVSLLFPVFVLAGLVAIGRPPLLAWCLAMLMLVAGGWANLAVSAEPGARERSFFGVSTILDRGDVRQLIHGTTVHGAQSLRPGHETRPLAYYAPGSGIASVMEAIPAFAGPRARVGFVGLGAGTLSCFARPGQSWTAYEIDPTVIRIARDSGQFTFIRRCAPAMRIVQGDARLTLAAEPADRFDLLVADAFSSDSIPLHLMTEEAFDIYGRVLGRNGVLVLNITNRYLDMEPVLAALAVRRGWSARVRAYQPTPAAEAEQATFSKWVVITQDEARMNEVLAAAGGSWRALRRRDDIQAWTDDFSSVLPVLDLR